MASAKLILDGANLKSDPFSAAGVLTYYVELDNAINPAALATARALVPKIGDVVIPGLVDGAPGIDPRGTRYRTTHKLRVMNVTTRIGSTNNASRLYADVTIGSKPQPLFQRGNSLIQKRVDTYLQNKNSIPILDTWPERAQIRVRYSIPKDLMKIGNNSWPPAVTPMPTQAGQTTVYFYSETASVDGTFYLDELPQTFDLSKLTARFALRVNSEKFFYDGDERQWLCTGVRTVTRDGGYSFTIGADFVFNPETWDPLIIYSLPGSNQPALLNEAAMKLAYTKLQKGVVLPLPIPNTENDQGFRRVPEYLATDLGPLLGAVLGRRTFDGLV